MSRKHFLMCCAVSSVLTAASMAKAVEANSNLNNPAPAVQSTPAESDGMSYAPGLATFNPATANVTEPVIGNEFAFAPKEPDATVGQSTDSSAGKEAQSASQAGDPKYLDAAPDSPNIHGFANLTLLTHYATPRGLVVADKDLVMQPIVGLVFPFGDVGPLKNLTFVGGIWNCITYSQHDPKVGPWNELDDFFSVSFDPITNLNANFTYVAFNSPSGGFSTEHNSDLYLSYNDSSFWGGNFGIHPYVDAWWAMAGDSTVVLGKPGSTFYIQPGISPQYTFKGIPSYPVTVKVPMYVSVGPKDYWSVDGAPTGGTWGGGNVGLFNAGVDVGIPLSFIPTKYGFWHADASVTYFDLVNNALLDAGTIVSGNTRRDIFVGAFQIGVSF